MGYVIVPKEIGKIAKRCDLNERDVKFLTKLSLETVPPLRIVRTIVANSICVKEGKKKIYKINEGAVLAIKISIKELERRAKEGKLSKTEKAKLKKYKNIIKIIDEFKREYKNKIGEMIGKFWEGFPEYIRTE